MFFYLFVAIVLSAPLYKGGDRPLPLLLLEVTAVALLLMMAVVPRQPVTLPKSLWIAVGGLLTYPLLQLFPLPESVWGALPGHAEYANVLQRFAADGRSAVRAISVIPSYTEYGWLAMMPALACFLAAMRLSPAHTARLLLIMAGFAGVESLLGLLQVGSGASIFYLQNDQAFGTATGTFINRNHLAALLAMTLPVIVGLLAFSMRPGRRRRHQHQRTGSGYFAQRTLLFGSAVLILACLLFTRSRAGIASALVGLACSAIVLVRARAASEGTSRTRLATWLVAAMIAVAFGLAIIIAAAPLLEGIEPEALRLSTKDRIALFAGTVRAAIEFLPFGSGLSTFVDVFPRFQLEARFSGFADHAHNDYLQAFMELGLGAPLIIGLLVFAYGSRMRELLRREGGRSFTLLQLGAGVGMMPMMLHSVFDFALHMPANGIWFATLAGVLFHPGVASRDSSMTSSSEQAGV